MSQSNKSPTLTVTRYIYTVALIRAQDILTDTYRFLNELVDKIKQKDTSKFYILVVQVTVDNIVVGNGIKQPVSTR